MLTIVDSTDRRPELLVLEPRQGVSGLLPRVRSSPLGPGHDLDRVGGVGDDVVALGLLAVDDLLDLLADLDHGVAESVDLGQALGLGTSTRG